MFLECGVGYVVTNHRCNTKHLQVKCSKVLYSALYEMSQLPPPLCYPTSTPNAGLELVPNFVLAHDRFFDEFCRSRLLDPLYAPGPGLYRSCLDAGPFLSSVPNVLPNGPRRALAIW